MKSLHSYIATLSKRKSHENEGLFDSKSHETRKQWSNAFSGFTLIELTIVMAIIAILAGITIQSFSGSQVKAQDARRKSDLHTMQQALEEYYNDHKSYPTIACSSKDACWGTSASSFLGAAVLNYIQSVPLDPTNGKGSCASTQYYTYTPQSSGQAYQLTAHIANASDPSIEAGSPNAISGATGCAANYQVLNP